MAGDVIDGMFNLVIKLFTWAIGVIIDIAVWVIKNILKLIGYLFQELYKVVFHSSKKGENLTDSSISETVSQSYESSSGNQYYSMQEKGGRADEREDKRIAEHENNVERIYIENQIFSAESEIRAKENEIDACMSNHRDELYRARECASRSIEPYYSEELRRDDVDMHNSAADDYKNKASDLQNDIKHLNRDIESLKRDLDKLLR